MTPINQMNMHQPIFCLLFSLLPFVSRLVSVFFVLSRVLPFACASSTALRAGLPSDRCVKRRKARACYGNMLAVATKLEQGVTHGTFTRQDRLAIFAVVLATAALAGGIVVAACLLVWTQVSVNVRVLRVASRARCGWMWLYM